MRARSNVWVTRRRFLSWLAVGSLGIMVAFTVRARKRLQHAGLCTLLSARLSGLGIQARGLEQFIDDLSIEAVPRYGLRVNLLVAVLGVFRTLGMVPEHRSIVEFSGDGLEFMGGLARQFLLASNYFNRSAPACDTADYVGPYHLTPCANPFVGTETGSTCARP